MRLLRAKLSPPESSAAAQQPSVGQFTDYYIIGPVRLGGGGGFEEKGQKKIYFGRGGGGGGLQGRVSKNTNFVTGGQNRTTNL